MRNKVKRTLSFLLTFVMLCSLLPMTAMAKELQPGEVAASKTASYDAKNHEVTITMTVEGKEASQITPSKADVVLVVDNSGSMVSSVGEPCKTPSSKFEDASQGWVECPECGARYYRGLTGWFVPDFCTGEKGKEPRVDTAKKVGKTFADSILSGENDNQMAVIGFAHGERDWLGSTDAIRQKLDLTKNVTDVKNTLDKMVADGGTDYTSALQEAYDMLNDRGETDRPGYVVFISDGAPGKQGSSIGDSNWDGSKQAREIKEAGYGLYTIGIALDDEADDHLESLASDNHYQNVTGTNYASELEELLKEWAEEINTVPAGTDAVLVDTISGNFTLKPNQNVENLAFDYENNQVTWNVGEITEEGKEVSFVVIPKEGVYDEKIPTNEKANLTYKDVNGKYQTLDVANATVNIPAPVEETVQLTYDMNGGTGAPETVTVNKNTEYYVLNTDTTPTHEPVDVRDVEFKGWSADKAVINQVYEKDNVPATVTTIDIAEENVTVYAVWAYKEEPPVGTVMLTYDANGGTGAPASATVNKNTEVTLDSTTTPTHAEADGKYVTFAGWSNVEAVKGAIYEKDSEPTTVGKVTVGETDVTVYAVWVYGDPVDPVDPPEPPTWELSKDKTATALDSNYNSKVTLSLPAGDYPQTVDVVFTVDCTSVLFYNYIGIIKEIEKIADELAGKDINLNVGLVGFGHESKVYLPLTNITEENVDAVMEEVKTTISNDGDWLRNNGGTNIQKGILTGRELLDNSNTGALPNDQYFILMTDGAGFWYNNANGETVCTAHKGDSNQSLGNMDANNDVGGPTRITDSMYLRAVNEGKTFGDFIAEQGAAIEKSAERSLTTEGAKSAGELAYTTQDVRNYDVYPYLNMERGTYFAAKALQEVAAEGYSVITIGYNYNKFGLTSLNAVSKGFREWTAEVGSYYTASMSNVQDAFEGVRDEMIYLLDAGSQVVDIIGQGKDDKGNDYNFDVANLDNMTITVGGVELNKVKIQSEEFPGSTTYGFFEGEIADDSYDFVVTYYPDGVADGETREHFVWSINTPVSKYAPAQFSYDVHLTNPQKVKGEYKVETNVEAVLTPVDSNGTVGSTETFPVPELTYEVKGGGSTTEHLMTVIVEGKGKVVVKDVQTVGANDTEVVEIPFGVEKQKFEMEAADGWKLDKVEVTINGKTENLGDVDKYEMDESLIDGAVLKAVFVKDNDGGSGGGGSHRPNNKPDETPEALNGDNHFDYVVGYSDGLVHPERNITRAEVASIFFRLLKDDVRSENLTDQNTFTDVSADAWYNVAVSTMSDMDIVFGRTDYQFDPDAYITRAEFAAIAARFDSDSYSGDDLFTDIEGHWAADQINRAAEKGWITGYPDGTFGPNRYITRAEAVTMINRVLNRMPKDKDALHEDMKVFVDNADTNAWYYLAIQEATNSHEYKKDKDGVYETWTDVLPARDWAQYLKLN
ncbi:S-layer homology domain-containing protein [Anaerotignum sp.]|uniref:S-layer homology domain-containing protein n=1 Tax=Anaerotignum sp. TaxID=2039241 RepID=UPI003A8B0AC8